MTGRSVEESLTIEFDVDEIVSKVGEVLCRIDEWVSVVYRKFDRIKRRFYRVNHGTFGFDVI